MRHLAGSENRITRLQPKSFVPDLRDVIPFDHIEPLILIVVQVARNTALFPVAMFHREETAA